MVWDGVIATPELIRERPELHHYTSIASLEGIAASKTLWATYYEDLNDSTEVIHLREPLINVLKAHFRQGLIRWRGTSLDRRRKVNEMGGVMECSHNLANDLVAAFYRVGFLNEDAPALAPPYITSFCSHAGDTPYERDHGLLSQWRGYGANGVCIVFRTAGLAELLLEEFGRHYWVHMKLDAAEYATDNRPLDELFPALIRTAREMMDGIFERGGLHEVPHDLMLAFLSGAPQYKHQAFSEEREVRFVGIPGTERARRNIQVERPDYDPGPLKQIQEHKRDRRRCRHMVLFEGLDRELPIERVIVGPSSDQDGVVERVRASLPRNVTITKSATPLICSS